METTRKASRPVLDVLGLGLRGLAACLILTGALLGGCGESPPPAEDQKASPTAPVEPPAATASAAAIRFTDVTDSAGIDFRHEAGATGNKWYPETMGAGGGFFDYDGDGWLDILLVNGRRWPADRQGAEPTMRLYRNRGDGTFADVTSQSGLAVPLYGMGMAAADYDNDGDQDLVITAYQQTKLFQNNGDGTFTDVTNQAGIAPGGWSTAAAFVDVDRDGWLDLFVGHYVDWAPEQEQGLDCTYGTARKDYCAVQYFRGLGVKLYRNLGDGSFADVTKASGVSAPGARVLGIAVVDFDDNGWPDVLVANDLTPSLLFANQGDGTFREIGVQTGLVLDEGGVAFAGMGIDAAYVRGDRQLCVAIGNFTGQPTTLHCQAPSGETYRPDVFIEQSHQVGLARPTLRMVTFGLFFFDPDLDGWLDLFMVNGHVVNEQQLRNVPYAQRPQLFRNQGDGRFTELEPSAQSGLQLSHIGRGAAYGDYDNDGDQDLLLTSNQGQAYLLRNDTPRPGHYLRVVPVGTRSNRDGIGARLRLVTSRRILRGMVRTGGSYLSQSETSVTFGLQADEQVSRLQITWPSGVVDVLTEPDLDRPLVVREGMAPTGQAVARTGTSAAQGTTIHTLKRTAMAHYQAGRFEAALESFQQALEHQPDDYIVQQYLIELFWRRGRHAEARTLLDTMGQALPDANFLMQFAFHLEEARLVELANLVYGKAAQLDPQAPEALYRLGKNALEAQRYDASVRYFQQALQRRDDLVAARHGLGIALAALGRTHEAETQFREVTRLAPDFADAYTHLGRIYTRSGRPAEAIRAYRTVITLQPDHARGYHNLGVALATSGQTDEAIQQFREAVQHQPNYLPALNDLGALYAERGDLARALAVFQAAVRSDAGSVQAHYNLAMAYGAQGDLAGMIREYQETLRLDPQHVEARFKLGLGLLQQNRPEAASEQFRRLIATAPNYADAHYLLGVSLAQLGQTEATLEAWQRTLQVDANHARAHSALASLYLQRQQYDLAWQHAQQAARLGAPVDELLEALRRLRGQAR